jgi:hypothetical protein
MTGFCHLFSMPDGFRPQFWPFSVGFGEFHGLIKAKSSI